MSITVPTEEPELIYAGQTVSWTKSLPDFPATDYTLKYYFSGPAAVTAIAAATYNTTDYLVTIPSATTAAYTYGIYSWTAFVEKGAGANLEKYFVKSGFLTIKTSSGKSFAKTMLDAIETILSGRATNKDLDLVSKSLGGAQIAKNPDLLMKYRNQFYAEYLTEVANEDRAQGKAPGSRVLMRFTRPS